MQKTLKRQDIEKLTIGAMLLALQVILGTFLEIPFPQKQFNLGFVPIAVAGALLGWPYALAVGSLGDIIGIILKPNGPFFPGFSLTGALVGIICGLILYRKKPSIVRVVILVSFVFGIIYLFLNSYWLYFMNSNTWRELVKITSEPISKTYWGWVSWRFRAYPIEVPVNIALVYYVLIWVKKMKLPSHIKLNE